MKPTLYAIFVAALMIFSISGSASMIIPANDNAKDNSAAPEKSPAIGDNWDIGRVDFIHYAKPESPAKPGKTTTCYKLMGVKWNTFPVNYAINPTNTQGLSESFITSKISTSAEAWDAATSKELFNNEYAVNDTAVYRVYNGQNAIVFGPYPNNGVIAVTSVWYSKRTRQILEFDMLFNTYFAWGNAEANPLLMDLQNIATHELGHSVGMNDIYTTTCSAVTMYGYSWEGDIDKRSLEQPDITGLRSMYGA
ncbi:MAG: matrixin family metalloprotease [Candidatus Woesearchaeota archaeon]